MRIVWRSLAVALVVTAAVTAATENSGDERAEDAFRKAFTEQLDPLERTKELERIVREHPESAWTDDALWVLGEAARRQGLAGKTVYYWQFLMNTRPEVKLQKFTESLTIYQASVVPSLKRLLEAEGHGFRFTGLTPVTSASGRLLAARNSECFNVVPMSVWAELGRCYELSGKPALALDAYRKALGAAPEKGSLPDRYRAHIRHLEMKVELRAKAQAAEKGKDRQAAADTAAPDDERAAPIQENTDRQEATEQEPGLPAQQAQSD